MHITVEPVCWRWIETGYNASDACLRIMIDSTVLDYLKGYSASLEGFSWVLATHTTKIKRLHCILSYSLLHTQRHTHFTFFHLIIFFSTSISAASTSQCKCAARKTFFVATYTKTKRTSSRIYIIYISLPNEWSTHRLGMCLPSYMPCVRVRRRQ